jgi:UDP-N-acetylglucosamine 4,6-dehydratase
LTTSKSRFLLSQNRDLDGASVLITGGTGTFGKQFCETILNEFSPRKVIVFSRDEMKQFEMRNSAAFREHDSTMRYFIGDVRDQNRLEMAFRDVDYVIHAAALKQVPAAEYNPFECIQTNVYGAENVVTAAIRTGVKTVIALSTDKATNPINLYGASKLAADKIFIAARNLVGAGSPLFAVVRYGNVIGSRGSIVPFFQNLIDDKADSLPITDERMTRFWITIQEGVNFVISCLPMIRGGELFVPKLPSMKIVDLANLMAPDLPTHTIGIRPGEKLHESMITEDDARSAIELPDRYVVRSLLYDSQNNYHDDEKMVSEDFRYASNTNTEWLEGSEMLQFIQDLKS